MGTITKIFLSLRTVFGLFLLFILIAVWGSVSLVSHLAFFSGIDDTPLFRWLSGAGSFGIAWWIWFLIFLLGLMAVSTILCTADALKRIGGKNLVLKLSPQAVHAGVLFIMLGHLLTATLGVKTDVLIRKGEKKTVTERTGIMVKDVKVETDKNGYETGWEAKLELFQDGKDAGETILRPVEPIHSGQTGFYFKSAVMGDGPSVLIRVSRDPGAIWALFGALLLAAGGIGFLFTRTRQTDGYSSDVGAGPRVCPR